MAHSAPLPNIQEALEGMTYPAAPDAIVARATVNHAAPVTLNLLRRLPVRLYRNVTEVNHALGEIETYPDPEMMAWSASSSQELEDEAQAKYRPRDAGDR